MEEQLVTQETAILAKEKGFDEVTDVFFNSSYPWPGEENINALRHSDGNDFTSVPTQSLLQKWLREKHDIVVFVTPLSRGQKPFEEKTYEARMLRKGHQRWKRGFKKWEEALEEGLQQGLNYVSQ